MGPKETLNTIQNLYERHKVLTYPRTLSKKYHGQNNISIDNQDN